MMPPRPRLYLVDAFNLIFRAYHARQRMGAPPMRTSRGSSTEAIYIFHNMIRKIQRVYAPDALAAAYESEGPTLRDQAFEAYKANRTETPQELKEQFPAIERMLGAMGVSVLKLAGYEADDIIGTVARRASAAGFEVTIVSSDKDMLQLVGDGVSMLDPMKNDTLYDPQKVKSFKGVLPERIADLLALCGDPVDNIPGAPGIGDKGAVQLLDEYGSLDNLLEHASEVQRKAYRESLLNHRDQILLSKSLTTIECNAPLELDIESLRVQPPDRETLEAFYREYEFLSFLKDLETASPSEPAPVTRESIPIETAQDLARFFASTPESESIALVLAAPVASASAPALPAAAPVQGELSPEPQPSIASGVEAARKAAVLPSLEIAAAIATAHATAAIPPALLPDLLAAIEKRPITVYDYKSLLSSGALRERQAPVEDLLLNAFLIFAEPSTCEFGSLCTRLLSGPAPSDPVSRAVAVHDVAAKLRPDLNDDYKRIYQTIDLPLAPVLARMERAGIRLDRKMLAQLSQSMETAIDGLSATIFKEARHTFNINSPQQLGKVLFEELGLPVQGKTGKTKSYSTAADVLETLAPFHPIAQTVLDYRQITKLKGTYVDALPLLMDSRGRVHTTFNPAGAATGRLSSSSPNLQNIPIRTDLGRDIRAAFVPEPGWTLLAADYSQIELRLLAHFSGDPVLVDSFQHNEDIHTRTASEVFGVAPLMVTPEMRRNAKAVNFGIVYGQTSFGLAAQIGVSRDEAEQYIKGYFERYAGVRKWLDHTIAEVRERGYTLTMHGRRRPIPDIQSTNVNARNFAERTAVNTPLQGTASDLIKLAMIQIDADLRAADMKSRMLLQVHDELVLECPPEELDAATKLVKRRMEGVAQLRVPLLVETGTGANWRDAK
ncbi:MAG: DNA polymerase I [Bryobacteraceae bacterium]|nr:DNA polymerase I [Bryobacteraceae bacterium]